MLLNYQVGDDQTSNLDFTVKFFVSNISVMSSVYMFCFHGLSLTWILCKRIGHYNV